MKMRIFGKKTMAVLLSVAMLMSCMVFSFSVDAAMTVMWENDFEDTTAPWHSVLKGEGEKGNFNSGTVGRTDVTAGNFAVYEEGADGNGYMKLGFGSWNSRKFLSGFHVRHKTATAKGATNAYGGGGAAAYRTGDGAFSPTEGKYRIEFDYRLDNMVEDPTSIIDICVGFVNAETFFWDGAKNLETFTNSSNGGEYYVAATVTKANEGADWAHATLYVDIEGNADRAMHIFLSSRYEPGNPIGSVFIDNFKMSAYDGVQDLDPDPSMVATKMWENHFDNGTDSNWMGMYTDSGKFNYICDPAKTAGQYSAYENGHMKLGYGNEAGESHLTGFIIFHEGTTHNEAGRYGYKGLYPYSANALGTFGPENGKNYAVTLDYKVENFNKDTTSAVELRVYAASEFYWESDRGFSYVDGTKKGIYQTVATVNAEDIANGWQAGAAYIEIPADKYTSTMMHVVAVVNGNVAGDLTEAEILIDNIQIYEYEADALPTVSYYNEEGALVGTSAPGLPGAPLKVPTLEGVPAGSTLTYFSDAACTKKINPVTVYPNADITVYVKAVTAESSLPLNIPEGKQAVYTATLSDIASVSLITERDNHTLYSLVDGVLTVAGRTITGLYGEGTYKVRAVINPVQDMATVEVTLPNGALLKRGRSALVNGNIVGGEIYATAGAEEKLTDVTLTYEDVTVNEFNDPTTSDEPMYTGFEANVYNLITSYDVDAKTTRAFAFTVKESFASAMQLQYRVKGATTVTTVDAIPVEEDAVNAAEDHYKVDLTGLTAGTAYEYRIGKANGTAASDWSAWYGFTTEAEDVEDFTFIVYGDSQARQYWNFKNNPGVAAATEYKRFADTYEALNEAFEEVEDPAFFLHMGDIVDSGEKTAWWNLFFKSLGDHGKTTPHFAVAGNHDVQYLDEKNWDGMSFNRYFNHPNNGGNAARDQDYYSAMTHDISKKMMSDSDEMIYSYNYGDAHFIVLNTGDDNRASKDYEMLHKSQKEWLINDLEANKDAKWTILMTHRPIYSPSGDSGSFRWLASTIEEYGVDLVLEAHDHRAARTYPIKNGSVTTKENPDNILQGSGTVYAMVTAACAWNGDMPDNTPEYFRTVTTLDKGDLSGSYTTISIEGDTLTMTTKKIDGYVIDEFTITHQELSTVSFYDGDTLLGRVTGEVGDEFTLPTLDGIPAGTALSYYSDPDCKQAMTLPTVFPEKSVDIYVLGSLASSPVWSFETEADGAEMSCKQNVYQGGVRRVSSAYARTGEHSLRMVNENGDDKSNAMRNQFVLKDGNGNYARVKAGKQYLLTYWILVPEDAMFDEYQGNLWLAGMGDATAGVNNQAGITDAGYGYLYDDNANGYVTVPADGEWHQVTRLIDTVTENNDGNVLVGMADMRSDSTNTWTVYLDDIQLICVSDMVSGGFTGYSDREQYLFDTTVGGVRTHLHEYYGDSTTQTGVFTSVRLGATYKAANADGDTILLGGQQYNLLERGIVVAEAAHKNVLDYDTYKWRTSKSDEFDACWEMADNGETKSVTYTLRLANISEAIVSLHDTFVYRSYYKIALPYYAEGAADTTVDGVYVYGNVSEEFSFLDIYNDCTNNGEDGGVWFDGVGEPPEREYSALMDAQAVLSVPVTYGYHCDGTVGEPIKVEASASWSYTNFGVGYGNTYTVSFISAWKPEVPYILLCDENDVIKTILSAETGDARNEVTFTVTDPTVTKVYVRSLSTEEGNIMVTQLVDSDSTVDLNQIQMLKTNIVTPYKYSAWPMMGVANGKLVCFYTEANTHEATETTMYMKTSSTNGLSWTEKKAVFTNKVRVGGVTGLGNDSQGNLLIWYRDGRAGDKGTFYEVYRMVGDEITKISTVDYGLDGPHVSNIFSVPGKGLFAFYNTYGDNRTYGVLKSTDDGVTWTNHPIETNVAKAECPVELDGFYLGDGKILALGRKDAYAGTIAMFQIESSDYGETWSRSYTNITDAYGSSPNMILDEETGEVDLYFFSRNEGKLKHRAVKVSDVWNNPQGWSESEVLITEPYSGQDTGNVKVVEINGYHFAAYYAGTAQTTGVYGVIINPEK